MVECCIISLQAYITLCQNVKNLAWQSTSLLYEVPIFEYPHFSSLSAIKTFHEDLHCGSKHFLTHVSLRFFAKERISGTLNPHSPLCLSLIIIFRRILSILPTQIKLKIIFWISSNCFVFGSGRTDKHCTSMGNASVLTTVTSPKIVRFLKAQSCSSFFHSVKLTFSLFTFFTYFHSVSYKAFISIIPNEQKEFYICNFSKI